MDEETERLRAEQRRRELAELAEVEAAREPAEEHAHERRADKAAYLREQLDARAKAEEAG